MIGQASSLQEAQDLSTQFEIDVSTGVKKDAKQINRNVYKK